MSGSKPGERRGGRQKGTRNKAVLEREAIAAAALSEAVALIPPEIIDALSPADFLNVAWRALAKAGEIGSAIAIAKEAAPYFNRKKAPEPSDAPADGQKIVLVENGPDADDEPDED